MYNHYTTQGSFALLLLSREIIGYLSGVRGRGGRSGGERQEFDNTALRTHTASACPLILRQVPRPGVREGTSGRHGVGKSPCEEPEKQIKNSKHARRRTETPHIHECIPCGKAFATSSALTKHILVHSGDKPYSCGLCGKASARADSFTVHLRVHRRGQ